MRRKDIPAVVRELVIFVAVTCAAPAVRPALALLEG